jgi:uncharacterized protein YcfJ
MILGGLIGGTIGHQFGSGDGKRAATVAGAVIGTALGHQVGAQRQAAYSGYSQPQAYPVERCETRVEQSWEERIEGYNVAYVYNGQRYFTRLPYDPGNRLRVRVDVRPEPG